MGRGKTIARRSFLIGSAVVLGGVAFGTYLVKSDPENPLAQNAGAGDAVFNPWVKITGSGITLVTPHTDLGQGATAMQAMLIAEELDVELDQISTTPGQPAAAYYNTALAAEAVPFRSNDDGFAASAMRETMGAVMKVLGAQVTDVGARQFRQAAPRGRGRA